MCQSKFHSYVILHDHIFHLYSRAPPPRYVPWWLACNPARYPYWFGRPDPRNALLLQEFGQQQPQ